jgi:hypothetical protein
MSVTVIECEYPDLLDTVEDTLILFGRTDVQFVRYHSRLALHCADGREDDKTYALTELGYVGPRKGVSL